MIEMIDAPKVATNVYALECGMSMTVGARRGPRAEASRTSPSTSVSMVIPATAAASG